MILIGLGANMPSPDFGPPAATLEAALAALDSAGVRVARRSRWYRSAPVPPSSQPPFVNGVAAIETDFGPAALLDLMLAIEARLGRVRSERWGPRCVDLDLLAYHEVVWPAEDPRGPPELPHPRIAERAFVLVPMIEIAADWRHPLSGRTASEMLARLPGDQGVSALDDAKATPGGSIAP